MEVILPLTLSLFVLFFFPACATNEDAEVYTCSHTGAEDSEQFLEGAEILVAAKAAIQFAILSLHEDDAKAATDLKAYLGNVLKGRSAGAEVYPDGLTRLA